MAMVYKWKEAAAVAVSAQVAGEELERIRVWNNGRLEADAVVKASRDPGAPLHPAFEWNDATAATAYRIDQARYMLRSIEVVLTSGEGDDRPIRAFVSVTRDNDRSYTSVGHAMSDPELRAQVVAAAWAELEAWRKRHAELIDFAQVFTAIDQARPA